MIKRGAVFMRKVMNEDNGQSKVEYGLILMLIAVSVVLILSSPRFRCAIKSLYMNAAYSFYLAGSGAEDSEQLFNQFMIENGLDSSEYDYNDGKINCGGAPGSGEPDPDPIPDPVPWL
ncbi:hypothetical protein J3A84_08505 [Proteiniclasticum sp. SCR006]|uniref:Uncharacterized protein n=1 Tax=Proteiniclasticum aestuarii TaxID=2817862 RepID=A0A939KH39_9CLOT|nr:hypothetical protein [Proteiniclasticum aestuarii]MBO1265064.1 hypothetical protein [Proteiniclasticum aestuarii]